MASYAQGRYQVKNVEKYLGNRAPMYRSSWEFTFMKMCDENPAILKWSSESIKIPYKNPFTGKHTIYVPDFLIHYIDAKGKTHTEVIEIKPRNQTIKEQAKSRRNQAHWALNQAKWAVAQHWCKQKGMIFRIINEQDIFHNVK